MDKRIVLDLPTDQFGLQGDWGIVAESLRVHEGDCGFGCDLPVLANAIEAAQGKRYVVLDVDLYDLATAAGALDAYRGQYYPEAGRVAVELRRQLDALTPPRPEEPTGQYAIVAREDAPTVTDVRVRVGRRWYALDPTDHEGWDSPSFKPGEVVSPGVGGEA